MSLSSITEFPTIPAPSNSHPIMHLGESSSREMPETGNESLSQFGKTDFAYHILVFHRVTSDHYILETMAESELDALKVNSEFWATNGINKSSKAFGKIRIG